MPHIEGESLSGHKVALPEAAAGKVAVLIFGFSRASKEQTGPWADRLDKDLGQADVDVYQLPEIQEAPRFVRGMIISGMRKGVAENKRDHFVVLAQDEDELKKLVSCTEADDAYLVLLDRQGRMVRQTHGAASPERVGEIEKAIEALKKK